MARRRNASAASAAAQKEEQMRRRQRPIRVAMRIILGGLILTLGVTFFVLRDQIDLYTIKRTLSRLRLDSGSTVGEGLEQSFYASDYLSVDTYNAYLTLLNEDGLSLYMPEGDLMTEYDEQWTAPAMDTAGKYIVVYEQGGTRLSVLNELRILFDTKLTHPILTAHMNEEGYLAVVTQGGGFKASVTVYDTNFAEVYAWHSAERYITDAVLSPDSGQLAVLSVGAEDGDLCSSLTLLDLASTVPVVDTKLGEGLASVLYYAGNNSLFVQTAEGPLLCDSSGALRKSGLLQTDPATRYAAAAGRYGLVTSRGILGDGYTVTVWDETGAEVCRINCPLPVDDLALAADRMIVLTNGKLLIYNELGQLQQQVDAGNDVIGAALSAQGQIYLYERTRVYRVA